MNNNKDTKSLKTIGHKYTVNGVKYIVKSEYEPCDGSNRPTLKEKLMKILSNESSKLTKEESNVTITNRYMCSTAGKED